MPKRPESYYDVITAAVRDLSEHGYDSADRVLYWTKRIREAAERTLGSPADMERKLREGLATVFKRLVDDGKLVDMHPGVARFTLEKVRPHLRAELDRRILASADLIKRNRAEAVETTLHRFQGWATSIPAGGSNVVDKVEEKTKLRKALAQLPFAERRVLIDQGHKLTSAINEIVAADAGALAGVWRSRWRQPGYDYREPHKEIDGQIYVVRGNWALEKGLMAKGPDGYIDERERPAELPFCRCSYQYIYTLRDLPPDLLTQKGREALAQAKAAIAAL